MAALLTSEDSGPSCWGFAWIAPAAARPPGVGQKQLTPVPYLEIEREWRAHCQGSRLVLLGSDRSVTALAQLPGLQSAGLPASGEAMAVA